MNELSQFKNRYVILRVNDQQYDGIVSTNDVLIRGTNNVQSKNITFISNSGQHIYFNNANLSANNVTILA